MGGCLIPHLHWAGEPGLPFAELQAHGKHDFAAKRVPDDDAGEELELRQQAQDIGRRGVDSAGRWPGKVGRAAVIAEVHEKHLPGGEVLRSKGREEANVKPCIPQLFNSQGLGGAEVANITAPSAYLPPTHEQNHTSLICLPTSSLLLCIRREGKSKAEGEGNLDETPSEALQVPL